MNPRDVLNKIRWDEGEAALAELEIWYLHRGAPDDTMVIAGRDVKDIERSYLVLRAGEQETRIPFHRVLRIVRGPQTVWERRAKAPAGPEFG
jgi:uncharacterized protein (UPF0248 family)